MKHTDFAPQNQHKDDPMLDNSRYEEFNKEFEEYLTIGIEGRQKLTNKIFPRRKQQSKNRTTMENAGASLHPPSKHHYPQIHLVFKETEKKDKI